MRFGIVGAGFSGAVVGRQLANAGHEVTIYDSRGHVAGNCHTVRDADTGILVHEYGPHIFHTDQQRVWDFVTAYGEFKPYRHQVRTTHSGKVYSMPINLHTLNQFFNGAMDPSDAKSYVNDLARKDISDPVSFEDQALCMMGEDLYKAFFKGYTEKQWEVSAKSLPASILKRLPMRFDYNDNYFSHPYQGMPARGYTELVNNILNHENIDVRLDSPVDRSITDVFDHVFCSAGLDAWFDYQLGDLGYRTLRFEREVHEGDYQGCAVMNYADSEIPYTRISEHKHFMPDEVHKHTIIFREFSETCGRDDIPYYPIRLVEEKAVLRDYVARAREEENTSFIGRLGTYRYLDMDRAIAEALDASEVVLNCIRKGADIPVFFEDPL